MSKIVVSFCISSYKRYEILKELVIELLSVDSDKFNVIINDDCSEDGTIEKISQIKDERLKIYVNEKNVGGPMNICKTLDRGNGQYIFYINERDNVDSTKVEKLISILEQIEEKNVMFALCNDDVNSPKDYLIYEPGEEAMMEFACRIVHPTGVIYNRSVWHEISKRYLFFEKECYGDYGLTLVSAMIAQRYHSAWIYGDICEKKRKRINFYKEKSRYYIKKKDQRIWYFPEVQWRELMISYRFMKNLNIKEECLEKILRYRYKEYLYRIVVQYKDILSDPENTVHYDINPHQHYFLIKLKSIKNGIFLWTRMNKFCSCYDKKMLQKEIYADTRCILQNLFV